MEIVTVSSEWNTPDWGLIKLFIIELNMIRKALTHLEKGPLILVLMEVNNIMSNLVMNHNNK